MSAQHTPGPWTCHDHAPWSVWAGNKQVAACRVLREDGSIAPKMVQHYDQSQANARLIAAAPELLAALRQLLDCPDLGLDELEPETVAAIEAAEAALSEATS